ncbi:MAG: bifunctional DNA-formamidopyrimidine glycosylase/DNA-(apurinic or apyrimidinic site) lyase [Planctomycetota bacterium]
MPELPEVETMRRGILGAVGGVIEAATRCESPRRTIRFEPPWPALGQRLRGRVIRAVDRLGKRVVVRLDSGESLVFEPRMTGLVLVDEPPSLEHLRFEMRLANCDLVHVRYWDQRGLGSVSLLTAEELAARLGPLKLGPDALAIDAETLRERLRSSRRPIKVALLDQRSVAGVGNLYASEILHVAAIHPRRSATRLTRDDWRRLHAALRAVLEEAIRYEGSTLSDGTYRNALNQSGGYQNHHRVYDREGLPCPRCGVSVIQRIVQAQRSSFFCGVCQR